MTIFWKALTVIGTAYLAVVAVLLLFLLMRALYRGLSARLARRRAGRPRPVTLYVIDRQGRIQGFPVDLLFPGSPAPFAEHVRRMDDAVWAAKARLARDQRAFPGEGHEEAAARLLREAGLRGEVADGR